ncbi:MAG: hypothetical protein V4632_15790 [Pseudomonadota bacterium]
MKTRIGTEKTVEQLIDAAYGNNLSARENYFCREAIFSLMRLARSEQMLEMKASVRKLTCTSFPPLARQAPKVEQCREPFYISRFQPSQFNRFD